MADEETEETPTPPEGGEEDAPADKPADEGEEKPEE